MSLGVDERSPSAAEASDMTEGWREWPGLILTTAGGRIQTFTHTSPKLVSKPSRKPVLVCNTKQSEPTKKCRGERFYLVFLWCCCGIGSAGSVGSQQ